MTGFLSRGEKSACFGIWPETTDSDKKVISSTQYIPVFSVIEEHLKGNKITKYFSPGKTESSYCEQYTLVNFYFDSELIKDGIYIKKSKEGKIDGDFSSVTKTFISKSVPLCRHYPCIPDESKLEGYVLADGKFISADCFYNPNPSATGNNFPCRNSTSGGSSICYSNDSDGTIQKEFNPYIHGLKLKLKSQKD